MRVLHAIDEVRLERGGVVRAVLDLVSGLSDAGLDITLLTGDATDADPSRPNGPRVETADWRVTPLLRPRGAGEQLRRAIAATDVVHLHTPWDRMNPVIAAEARRQSKPYFVSVHGMLDDWCVAAKALKKHAYLALVARKMLSQAAGVHFTTETEAEQSMRRLPAANPLVVPLLLDLSPCQGEAGRDLAVSAFPAAFAGEGPRVLFLGRLQAIKGLPLLIDALASMTPPPAGPPHLLLAGPAEEAHDEELRRLAESAGLGDRVHFLGMVGGETKRSLFEAADLFVLPSHHENFGIALAEAMMCGAPCVTSDQVGIWREVQQLGAMIVPHSAAGFAKGVGDALADIPNSRRTAKARRSEVADWLNPERIVSQYRNAYEAAIQGKKPG